MSDQASYKKPPISTRFKPGQSGNPGGLPRGTVKLTPALGKLLRTPAGEAYRPTTKGDEVALKLFERAVGGDVAAIQLIWERVEGRTPQTLNIAASELPTTELVARLVEAFAELGVDESTTRRVLLSLGSGDDNGGV